MLRLNQELGDMLEIAELPVLPEVVLRLLGLFDGRAERPPLEQLSRYLFADVGLAARAVALATRAGAPRLPPRAGALARFLVPAGTEAIRGLTLAVAGRSLLSPPAASALPTR